MTAKEARKFVAILMATYPNYHPNNAELTANIWADVTKEYTYEQVSMGLKAYMQNDTSGFAPAPGQVIERIHRITTQEALSEDEAWAIVLRAIRRSTYYSVEEFEKLPGLAQKCVGSPQVLQSWAAIEAPDSLGVVRSNFVRAYRNVSQRHEDYMKLSPGIRRMIDDANRDRPAPYIKPPEAKQIEAKLEEPISANAEILREKIEELKKKLSESA